MHDCLSTLPIHKMEHRRWDVLYIQPPGKVECLSVFIYKFSLKGNWFGHLSLVPVLVPLCLWLAADTVIWTFLLWPQDCRGVVASEIPKERDWGFYKVYLKYNWVTDNSWLVEVFHYNFWRHTPVYIWGLPAKHSDSLDLRWALGSAFLKVQ